MRFYDADLISEHRAMQTRISTLEAENRGKDETIQKLLDGAMPRNSANDAEYLTRLGQLAEKYHALEAENALLLKALEQMPHTKTCRSHITCSIPEHGCAPCDCPKAALDRIPEAKPHE